MYCMGEQDTYEKNRHKKEAYKNWKQWQVLQKAFQGTVMQGWDQECQNPPAVESGKGCEGQREGLLQVHHQKEEECSKLMAVAE